MMVIKVIIFILLYMLLGVGVLEVMLWHDRNVDYWNIWVENDEGLQVLVVLFMPISLIFVAFYLIFLLVLLFIKAVRMIFTTLVYMIICAFNRCGRDMREDE